MANNSFAIIGSGFGLYGYLPVLVDACAQRVVLPARYRPRFDERPELARFASDVEWQATENDALDRASGVLLAVRPSDQVKWIPQCLARSGIERLLLEKPLANSPERAARTLDDLIRSQRPFRVGYLFRYTSWGQEFLRTLDRSQGSGCVSIRWRFLAHHFRHDIHNWKRSAPAGGGVIRFFGIHLLALLAEAGYRDVISSVAVGTTRDDIERWTATVAGPGLSECELLVDTRSSATEFRVEQAPGRRGGDGTVFANLEEPFDTNERPPRAVRADRRTTPLGRLCQSLWDDRASSYKWYESTNDLWQSVEARTHFEIR